MEKFRDHLDKIAHYLGDAVPLAIALALGGIALSGRLSVTAAQVLFIAAWIALLIGFRGQPIHMFVIVAVISTAALVGIAV